MSGTVADGVVKKVKESGAKKVKPFLDDAATGGVLAAGHSAEELRSARDEAGKQFDHLVTDGLNKLRVMLKNSLSVSDQDLSKVFPVILPVVAERLWALCESRLPPIPGPAQPPPAPVLPAVASPSEMMMRAGIITLDLTSELLRGELRPTVTGLGSDFRSAIASEGWSLKCRRACPQRHLGQCPSFHCPHVKAGPLTWIAMKHINCDSSKPETITPGSMLKALTLGNVSGPGLLFDLGVSDEVCGTRIARLLTDSMGNTGASKDDLDKWDFSCLTNLKLWTKAPLGYQRGSAPFDLLEELRDFRNKKGTGHPASFAMSDLVFAELVAKTKAFIASVPSALATAIEAKMTAAADLSIPVTDTEKGRAFYLLAAELEAKQC
jgi:hypothetical protein